MPASRAGILGIAYGRWWALRNSVAQLMNKRPSDVENQEKDPVIDKVQETLEGFDWVARAKVRLREDRDVLTGEASWFRATAEISRAPG